MASELAIIASTTKISALRRSSRSATAPRTAPNNPIGSSRSMVSMATMKADPVAW